jgi:hypothetical protein
VVEPCWTSLLAVAPVQAWNSLNLAVVGRNAYQQAGCHAGIVAIERMPWAGVKLAPA